MGLDRYGKLYAIVSFHWIRSFGSIERLDGCRCAAAVILAQRNEHPSHRSGLVPVSIEDVLPFDDFLFLARKRLVCLAITHAAFASASKKIPVNLPDA
jgi:hypothetical protein